MLKVSMPPKDSDTWKKLPAEAPPQSTPPRPLLVRTLTPSSAGCHQRTPAFEQLESPSSLKPVVHWPPGGASGHTLRPHLLCPQGGFILISWRTLTTPASSILF